MPILIFENGKKYTTENNLDYIQYFVFVLFLGKHAKLILCANKLRVNSFFFLLPIHFISFYFSFLASVCVSEFINIHFNKHTKSAVCVCMGFFFHIWVVLLLGCLQRKQQWAVAAQQFFLALLNFMGAYYLHWIIINCFYLILWCHYLSNWKRFLCLLLFSLFVLCFFFFSISVYTFFIHSLTHSLAVCLLNYIWLEWKH